MELLAQEEMVIVQVSLQEDGALRMPGGLIDTVEQCEPDGRLIKVVISVVPPLYVFPKKMLPCFLRYAAKNPIEHALQKEIAKFIKEGQQHAATQR